MAWRHMTVLAAIASVLSGSPSLANTEVNEQLNMADTMFRLGADGCVFVNNAIMKANTPELSGPTSAEVRAEVAQYAARCGLRF